MRIFFVFAVLIMICSHKLLGQAELVQSTTRNAYENKSYVFTIGMSLLPGFRVSGASNGTFFIKPAEAVKIKTNTLVSADRNLVRAEKILVGGITSVDQLGALTDPEKATMYHYLDDMGRPVQTVDVRQSPAGFDIVKPYAYDGTGKMDKDYLLYSSPGRTGEFRPSALQEQGSFYTTSPKVPSDPFPFQEYIYEKSPLNRIEKAIGPGSLWREPLKFLQESTQLNAAGEVRLWTILNGYPNTTSSYPGGTLFVRISNDEDGRTSKSYTDFQGREVLNITNGASTYYVYDELSQLRFVLPPELVNDYPTTTVTIALNDPVVLNRWTHQYKYDNRGRVSQMRNPGPDNDWTYYVYDQWDRVVLEQDGVQRRKSPQEWSFIKYDALNRPIVKGIINTNSSADHNAMISAVAGARFESENTSSIGYTVDSTFPKIGGLITSLAIFTITYYDDYSFLNISGWSELNSQYNATGTGFTYLSTPRGQVTGRKVKVLDQGKWLTSTVYYDDDYNPVQIIEKNNLTSVPDRVTNKYNFAGDLIERKRVHYVSTGDLTITENFEYDHAGRISRVYHQINTQPSVLLASYAYNEAGYMVEKNLHSEDNGSSFIQSVDYRYNIRGWLTSINNASLSNDGIKNDDNTDLFGIEYVRNEETLNINGQISSPKFNGTITAAKWKSNNLKTAPQERVYGYSYNNKNWISSASYATKSGSSWTGEGGFYNLENLTYDENGNLLTLKRYDRSGSARRMVDNLSYGYSANGVSTGDQLASVEDSPEGRDFGYPNKISGIQTELQYDKNGNLTSDLNSEITQITYNILNLPGRVTIDLPNTNNDYQIDFVYDASGYLWKRTISKGGAVESTIDYIKGIHYTNSLLRTIFTSEGRATKVNGEFEYEYFLKDHLQNNRVVFGKLSETHFFKATMENYHSIVEERDFINIPSTRFAAYNLTKPSLDVPVPDKSAKVNGYSPGSAIGPAKLLTVSSGDVVELDVYARYASLTSNNAVISNLVAAVTSSFGLVNAGETQVAYQALNSNLPSAAAQIIRRIDAPKAYLFYILFDKNHVYKQFGYSAVEASALLSPQKLSLKVTVPEDGFMYTYVANESNVNDATAAFFDDFTIIQRKRPKSLRVIEVNDYDPFGYVLGGTRYIDESALAVRYGYQSDFAEFDDLLGWNRFSGRGNYDPRLGRWHSYDPMSQFPGMGYVGMVNDPLTYIDPNGELAFVALLVPAIVGGVGNVISNWDDIVATGNFGQGALAAGSYFGVGAIAGVVSITSPLGTAAGAGILAGGNALVKLASGGTPTSSELMFDFGFGLLGGSSARGAFDGRKALQLQMGKLPTSRWTDFTWDNSNRIVATTTDDAIVGKELATVGEESIRVLESSIEVISKRKVTVKEAMNIAAKEGSTQFTKSSLQLGRQMHTGYKAGLADGVTTFKEFTGIKGIRPDFVDFSTKTIYELKPFNPRSMELGKKQLSNYKKLFEQKYGGVWNTVLDTY